MAAAFGRPPSIVPKVPAAKWYDSPSTAIPIAQAAAALNTKPRRRSFEESRAHGGELARIFKREALSELARLSGGIPRRINMLCHNALMLAYAQQARRAGATHIRDAARDYDNLLADSLDSSKDRRRGFVFKAAAALGDRDRSA